MVALAIGGAELAAFDAGELFESAVILLDGPGEFGESQSMEFVHAEVVGGPMCRVAVWGNDPKHFGLTIARQPDHRSGGGDRLLIDGPRLAVIETDLAIAFQSREENPAETSDVLEVFDAGVPTVEEHGSGLKAAFVSGLEHLREVIVLRLLIALLVVNAIVAGIKSVAVGPDRRDQIDAADDGMMIAGPVISHQFDVLGPGLVERRIIDDQHPAGRLDQRSNLVLERGGIRFETMQRRVNESWAGNFG